MDYTTWLCRRGLAACVVLLALYIADRFTVGLMHTLETLTFEVTGAHFLVALLLGLVVGRPVEALTKHLYRRYLERQSCEVAR